MILRLLFCLASSPQLATSPPAGAAAFQEPLPTERVVVLGASASAGFGLRLELGSPVSLADFLGLALEGTGGRVQGLADPTFFIGPLREGQAQVEHALELNPTLVIAVDFAFWYGYGDAPGCEDRLASFERCLEQLERLTCPILLGDFPNMTPALKGHSPFLAGGAMLRPAQVPSADCRALLNRRLGQWAQEQPNVRVFPLAFFMAEIGRVGSFDSRGLKIDADEKLGMLQTDLLHPTAHGTAIAALFILHHLVEAGWLEAKSVTWDLNALEKTMRGKAAAAHEKKNEKPHQRHKPAGEEHGNASVRSAMATMSAV